MKMADNGGLGLGLLNSANSVISPLGDTTALIVHIEVCLKPNSVLETSSIQNEVDKYLLNEEEFILNQAHYNTVLPCDINYIRISSTENKQKVNFLTQNIKKHYHFFEPWQYGPEIEFILHENEDVPALLNWCLPNADFEGLWESLILENGLKEYLMSYVQTMLLYSDKKINTQMVLYNSIVLLYGPPGTGKTSLCKALAQKLSIRLNSKYKTSRLIEINSHSLFSKWFSESPKLIFNMFSLIKSWLQSEDHFVCILMDEVESLVHSRKSSNSDPSDSIRVVNTVLTQIDQLQKYPNFLILATSNLVKIIDSAFNDRADLKIYIPYPSSMGIYEILKSCIEELISHDLVRGNKNDFFDGMIAESMRKNFYDESNDTLNEIAQNTKALMRVSAHSFSFGGRTLRKIPFLTSAKFIDKETPSILEFLTVMESVVQSLHSALRNGEFQPHKLTLPNLGGQENH